MQFWAVSETALARAWCGRLYTYFMPVHILVRQRIFEPLLTIVIAQIIGVDINVFG